MFGSPLRIDSLIAQNIIKHVEGVSGATGTCWMVITYPWVRSYWFWWCLIVIRKSLMEIFKNLKKTIKLIPITWWKTSEICTWFLVICNGSAIERVVPIKLYVWEQWTGDGNTAWMGRPCRDLLTSNVTSSHFKKALSSSQGHGGSGTLAAWQEHNLDMTRTQWYVKYRSILVHNTVL